VCVGMCVLNAARMLLAGCGPLCCCQNQTGRWLCWRCFLLQLCASSRTTLQQQCPVVAHNHVSFLSLPLPPLPPLQPFPCTCSGYGYGAGIRLDSPLGPVRLEYAWNEQRSGRFHVALGYD
jgi:hypothetical protein